MTARHRPDCVVLCKHADSCPSLCGGGVAIDQKKSYRTFMHSTIAIYIVTAVRLASLFGEPRPLILQLDYSAHRTGGLTYRQLHHQVRESLALEKKVSLRMCSFRPWYRYITQGFPLPENCALPAKDIQCRHLLGTTLLYATYVHRN